MPDLLLELFSEEIPARMQARAAEDLQKLVTNRLVEAGLTYSEVGAFVTPRRLCLHLTGLPAMTKASREERKGPRVDAPEKALEGFLRATGLTKDELEARDDKKGQVWFAVIKKPGRLAAEVVAEAVTETVRSFPWPKSMRWGSGNLRWVRPLHSILCILTDEHGPEVVPFEIDGIAAGDTTQGHRFMGRGPIRVRGFEDYVHKLKAAHVVLDPAERAARIEHDAKQLAFAQGAELVEDKGLLAEVAGLVEWPMVLMGEIGEAFLDLPAEVLQTSMKAHQKFFSVRNPKTGRIERFVTVANIEAPDHGQAILAGNGRVLAARLSDARFFWDNDLRVIRAGGMAEMAKELRNVVFHARLGSQTDRIDRIAALAREIAPKVGANPDHAELAARVAKADLASEMVVEFPELQGIMGVYYAKAEGLPDEVANACEAHYRPLGPSDAVPTEPVSVAVALADKIDMLTGFWAIDEKPTGSKDPFALRRAALGVIRIVLANDLRLELTRAVFSAMTGYFAYSKSENIDEEYFARRVEMSLDSMIQSIGFSSVFYNYDYSAGMAFIYLPELVREHLLSDLRGKPNKLFEILSLDPDNENDKETVASVASFIQRDWEIVNIQAKVWEDPELIRYDHARGSTIFDRYPEFNKYIGWLTPQILSFFADRLKVALRDQGIRHDVIQACFELGGQDDLVLLVSRVRALQDFLATEDGANLLVAYRRAANIVGIEESRDGVEYSGTPDVKFAEQDEERALFAALDAAEPAIAAALKAEDFAAAMAEMAKLRPVVDSFFDKVTVNAENQITRRNRLCLLHRIRTAMRQVAVWEAIEG